jgi:hypothetical protein
MPKNMMVWSYRKNARYRNPKKRRRMESCMQQDEEKDQK